jgi:hypothetical protein
MRKHSELSDDHVRSPGTASSNRNQPRAFDSIGFLPWPGRIARPTALANATYPPTRILARMSHDRCACARASNCRSATMGKAIASMHSGSHRRSATAKRRPPTRVALVTQPPMPVTRRRPSTVAVPGARALLRDTCAWARAPSRRRTSPVQPRRSPAVASGPELRRRFRASGGRCSAPPTRGHTRGPACRLAIRERRVPSQRGSEDWCPHFESVCDHPLVLFNAHGDCLAADAKTTRTFDQERPSRCRMLPILRRQIGHAGLNRPPPVRGGRQRRSETRH